MISQRPKPHARTEGADEPVEVGAAGGLEREGGARSEEVAKFHGDFGGCAPVSPSYTSDVRI